MNDTNQSNQWSDSATYFKPSYQNWLCSQSLAPNNGQTSQHVIDKCPQQTSDHSKPISFNARQNTNDNNRVKPAQNNANYLQKIKFSLPTKRSTLATVVAKRDDCRVDNVLANNSADGLSNGSGKECCDNVRVNNSDSVIIYNGFNEDCVRDRFYDTSKYSADVIIKGYNHFRKRYFYCGVCDVYVQTLFALKSHISLNGHINKITHKDYKNHRTMYNRLNRKFAPKLRHKESISRTHYRSIIDELEMVTIDAKHYYCKRGIQLMDGFGSNAYYCCFCRKSINSFKAIELHLRSEAHRLNDNLITFDRLMFKCPEQVIAGVQFIVEYGRKASSNSFRYECTLCCYFSDACDMFGHVCCFKHRLKLLEIYRPDSLSKYKIESIDLKEMLEKEILSIADEYGIGAISHQLESPANQQSTKPNNHLEIIRGQISSVNNDSELRNLYKVKVTNDWDAVNIDRIVKTLNDAIIRYELKKMPEQTRVDLMKSLRETEDNYELCDMDLSS